MDHTGYRAALMLCLMPWFFALTGCVSTPDSGKQSAPLAILLGKQSASYSQIAQRMVRRYQGPTKLYVLQGDRAEHARTLRQIERSNAPVVVAVGLNAALVAKRIADKKIIFCQVMNYKNYNLISPRMKGVGSTPSISKQLHAWSLLDPNLNTIGIVTGKSTTDFAAQVDYVAKKKNITLIRGIASSDKELLYAFKRMNKHIQGFWLVPDNHILSVGVMRELLAYSLKHGKQVLVFNPQLLSLGGLLSAEADENEIVSKILLRVSQASTSSTIPGRAVLPLNRATIRINPVVAKRLDLRIPPNLKRLVYAP